jgi:hypothetical protein
MRILILGPLALLLVSLVFADCVAPPAAPTSIPSSSGDPGAAPTKVLPTPTIEIPPPID